MQCLPDFIIEHNDISLKKIMASKQRFNSAIVL